MSEKENAVTGHHGHWCLRCGCSDHGGPAGDLGRAVPLFEQTLSDTARVLGKDHPDTLTARNNLAYAHQSAGDLARAIPLYEQTANARAQLLGEDHPSTLTTRNNLAYAYQSAGDLSRAISLFEQTLSDAVRVLGDNHRLTQAVRCAHLAARALQAVEAATMRGTCTSARGRCVSHGDSC